MPESPQSPPPKPFTVDTVDTMVGMMRRGVISYATLWERMEDLDMLNDEILRITLALEKVNGESAPLVKRLMFLAGEFRGRMTETLHGLREMRLMMEFATARFDDLVADGRAAETAHGAKVEFEGATVYACDYRAALAHLDALPAQVSEWSDSRTAINATLQAIADAERRFRP